MAGKGGGIDLTTLHPQQLASIKEQFEQEIQSLYQSLQTMQNIAKKYSHSAIAIGELKEQEPGKPLMLPLTSSLYVSGELEDPSTVMVDVGTGYYVEKKCDEGIDFCKRKMDLLKKNSEAIVPQIREKQEMTNQVNKVYQMKMQQQMAEQAQAGGEAQ
eukprot:CAMPEP_0177773944 /NCGR_PEP_ID=MMETSP0491_2-20121128/13194_1 /TAXON_ID=63592 /ORGANISM="Tetraselmis chuii, Strain PLY429" /LENGTH=157 /DNA_ID=CAMNT_0019292191 /DNA_START=252 /DNA_END=725 /DNA_ORIENTATION=-